MLAVERIILTPLQITLHPALITSRLPQGMEDKQAVAMGKMKEGWAAELKKQREGWVVVIVGC